MSIPSGEFLETSGSEVNAASDGDASVGRLGRDTPKGIEAGLPDADTAASLPDLRAQLAEAKRQRNNEVLRGDRLRSRVVAAETDSKRAQFRAEAKAQEWRDALDVIHKVRDWNRLLNGRPRYRELDQIVNADEWADPDRKAIS